MKEWLSRFADKLTEVSSHPYATALAILLIVLWLPTIVLLPFDTSQLLINTTTTIITFVMVFGIQHSTSRETKAILVKLDELLVLSRFGIRLNHAILRELPGKTPEVESLLSDVETVVGVEKATDDELERIRLAEQQKASES